MTDFGPFCSAHSLDMFLAAHEGRETELGGMCATLCGQAAQQRILHYSRWRKVPEENVHWRRRFGPCRLDADIYERIVSHVGMVGGIVKRATIIGRIAAIQAVRLDADKRQNRILK